MGEIIDVESGLEENEDDRKCVKELATVDHIKMDELVEPSASNNNFFGPSSNDGSADVDPSLSATTLPPITVATLLPTTTTVTGTMSNSTKVVLATDLSWVRKHRALEGATADRKSPPALEHPFKTIPANPELANKLGQKPSKLFSMMQATAAGYQSDEVRPVANMSKDQILRAGLRTEGERTRLCMTYAFMGVLSVALTADAKSAPPLIADLVPGHNQTKEFDKKSGSTGIDAGKEFAKPLVSEALRMRQAIFIEGGAGKKVLLDVIREEGLIVEYLTDEMIARRVQGFENL